MIVFGWRTRFAILWEGMFACPYERQHRQARLREARRWFTLFWIPVIPLARLGRAVECSGCGLSFKEQVLADAAPAPQAQTLQLAPTAPLVQAVPSAVAGR
ncbi:hypothetical protein [Euzebya pacifica]|jgi:hypothetical protein|uniref:hypothetical protein n=1 Tax=Euzebya pacifica TaxID=1608957 RepID=UPI0030F8395C